MLQRVHSVDEAEETLYRRGYYDIRLERASLPYSFNACKRGVRYHIHVNYYGDLVQVDEVGSCRRSYDDGAYYGRRPYYDRYRDYRRRDYKNGGWRRRRVCKFSFPSVLIAPTSTA